MGLISNPFCTPKFLQSKQLFPEEGWLTEGRSIVWPNSPWGRFIIDKHQFISLPDYVYNV